MKRFLLWIWKDPRRRVTIVLVATWLVALTRFSEPVYVWVPLFVVSVGAVADLVVQRMLLRRWKFPSSAGVTSWLVALILDPTTGMAPMVAAVLLALGSKYLLRFRRHWFNPAAFGILTSAWIFDVPVAWWVVSWSWIPAAMLLVGMFSILQRLKRLWLPAIFFVIYAVWLAATSGNTNLVSRTLLDGTVILFAVVMVTEPMTSPAHGKWRYGFGALVAAMIVLLIAFRFTGPPDLFLLSLLLADAVAGILLTVRRSRPTVSPAA